MAGQVGIADDLGTVKKFLNPLRAKDDGLSPQVQNQQYWLPFG